MHQQPYTSSPPFSPPRIQDSLSCLKLILPYILPHIVSISFELFCNTVALFPVPLSGGLLLQQRLYSYFLSFYNKLVLVYLVKAGSLFPGTFFPVKELTRNWKDGSKAEGIILSRWLQFDVVIRAQAKKSSVDTDCPHSPVLCVSVIFMTAALLNNKYPRLTSKSVEAAAISQQKPKGQQKFQIKSL